MPRPSLLPALTAVAGAALACTLAGAVAAPVAAAAPATVAGTATAVPAAGSSRAPGGGRHVSTSAGLVRALAAARPGTVLHLRRGVYSTRRGFTVSTRCTAAAPCVLRGGPGVVLDGHGLAGVYGLHLDRASYWTVTGLTVRSAAKGVVLDRSSHDTLSALEVRRIGDEGIHLRSGSSYDLVTGCSVHHTGRRTPRFGEGVYVGSARSNWRRYTRGRPDRSDHDVVTRNRIWATGAESVDIKEGTRGGTLSRNHFDGRGMRGRHADSWVDVKGNRWRIVANHGVRAPRDGFQTHVVVPGWGRGTVFRRNVADTRSAGYGIDVSRPRGTGTVVACDNIASSARAGLSNQRCR